MSEVKELKGKLLNDVHKIVFLVDQYPEHDIKQISALFQMTPFDFNVATWKAEDEGFITINQENGKIDRHKTPKQWHFGDEIEYIVENTPYVLQKLAEREADIEENYFANYIGNYASHDAIVAVKYMLVNKVIGHYTVKDTTEVDGKKVTDEYIFYTLNENLDKRWGEKQFKDESQLSK